MSKATSSNSPAEVWNEYPEIAGSKLFHEYLTRLTSGRDMHVIVTAAAETGVGKTTLAFTLAMLWDQNGWTHEKATLDPREYAALYDDVEPGSVLLLDEVEQAADARRGGSRDNVNLSQNFATKRYRQVFGLMTAPSKGWVDGRIGNDSADYWIQALETDQGRPKGEAKVYRLRENEHYEQSYSKRVETISWPILDWHEEFRKLEQLKIDRMEGQVESDYVHREDHKDAVEAARNEGEKEAYRKVVRECRQWGMNQTEIADIVGVSQGTVSNWLGEMDGIE